MSIRPLVVEDAEEMGSVDPEDSHEHQGCGN